MMVGIKLNYNNWGWGEGEGTTRYSVFLSLFYADILNRERKEKEKKPVEERIRFSKITFETKTSKERYFILKIENSRRECDGFSLAFR